MPRSIAIKALAAATLGLAIAFAPPPSPPMT